MPYRVPQKYEHQERATGSHKLCHSSPLIQSERYSLIIGPRPHSLYLLLTDLSRACDDGYLTTLAVCSCGVIFFVGVRPYKHRTIKSSRQLGPITSG